MIGRTYDELDILLRDEAGIVVFVASSREMSLPAQQRQLKSGPADHYDRSIELQPKSHQGTL
jgi:hypothetical protein